MRKDTQGCVVVADKAPEGAAHLGGARHKQLPCVPVAWHKVWTAATAAITGRLLALLPGRLCADVAKVRAVDEPLPDLF